MRSVLLPFEDQLVHTLSERLAFLLGPPSEESEDDAFGPSGEGIKRFRLRLTSSRKLG